LLTQKCLQFFLVSGLQRGGRNSCSLDHAVDCNGRQAVMSALEALVLAGKGLNAFSVLFFFFLQMLMMGV
jgi:hypothetical protein